MLSYYIHRRVLTPLYTIVTKPAKTKELKKKTIIAAGNTAKHAGAGLFILALLSLLVSWQALGNSQCCHVACVADYLCQLCCHIDSTACDGTSNNQPAVIRAVCRSCKAKLYTVLSVIMITCVAAVRLNFK
jgi:hypothetical protein